MSEKGWKSLKRDLKTVTRKTTPSTFDERISKLKEIQRGWLNYFRMGSIQAKLKEIDSWLRNRLRYCIWEDWKKTERKKKNLNRLGIPTGQAYAWSRTRMGGWAVAQSPIMVTTITLKRLIQRGYESLLSYYERISPQLNEPLYTSPAWPALRNRRVQWSCLHRISADKCERRTSPVNSGEAVYSIVRSAIVRYFFKDYNFIHLNLNLCPPMLSCAVNIKVSFLNSKSRVSNVSQSLGFVAESLLWSIVLSVVL